MTGQASEIIASKRLQEDDVSVQPLKKRLRASTQWQANDSESVAESGSASCSHAEPGPSTLRRSTELRHGPTEDQLVKAESYAGGDLQPTKLSGVGEEHSVVTDAEALPSAPEAPLAEPKIWAKRRQGLCDALPYFKSHQGSLYTTNRVPHGLLIAKEARARDHFDGQVIITTVGGGRVKDEKSGQMIRVRDQEENRNVMDFRFCKEQQLPIAVIACEDHPLFPVTAPHPYCVLDYFQVTDIWAEKQVYLKGRAWRMWCVRLEKIELHTPSWWDPATPILTTDAAQERPCCEEQVCRVCTKSSKTIFIQGWLCLNHACYEFLKTQGKLVDVEALKYTPAFLAERTPFTGQPPSLSPPLPTENMPKNSLGSEKACRVGMVCPDCGCCSSRRSWDAWECENCDYVLPGQMLPYPLCLVDKERRVFEKRADRTRQRNGAVDLMALQLDYSHIAWRAFDIGTKYKVTQYLLPGEGAGLAGSVTVLHADASTYAESNGPNRMFAELCARDIGLRRNPVKREGSKTEIWTRHFAQNWGAPYKFGVAVRSKSFAEAPPAVLMALHRLIWAGKTAAKTATEWIAQRGNEDPVPAGEVSFNELLSLGYMEGDRISYHDDGEKELGPTVATLSLGSPATMSFRPKKKADVNTSMARKPTDGEYYEVLTVPVFHGDFVVMHGTDLHKLYDHKVDPNGGRRFAMTSRYITPEKIEKVSEREDAVKKGTLPPNSFDSYAYAGGQA